MVTFAQHDGIVPEEVGGPLVDLYAVVYAEPPYCEGPEQVHRFRTSLHEDANRSGFTLVTAIENETLIGATYGWSMPAGKWWSNADQPPRPDVLSAEKFAVMEWIVTPAKRGQGIGGALIRRLLDHRTEQYATLASDPRSDARAIYRKSGWRQVGVTKLSWGPEMDLLLLDLPQGHQGSREEKQ